MTFQPHAIIKEGDTVILYFNRDNINHIIAEKGKEYICRFGAFKHDNIIGSPFGLKLTSHTGRGFVYLFFPTPELWTLCVPHRTQILYQPDIAFVSSYLDLKPGVRMIESGTGSGSFSHSIARTIGSKGHLYTFEYHKERVEMAKLEFELHGLNDIITVTHRNVCKEGFQMENEVTAVFLDLPAPWEAVSSAKKAFKTDTLGRICSFSPCIEQVQRTCAALTENGFTEIKTFECLTRGNEIKAKPVPTLEHIIKKLGNKILKRKANEMSGNKNGNEKETLVNEPETEYSSNHQLGNGSEELSTALESNNESDSILFENTTVSKASIDLRGHTSYLTFAFLSPQFSPQNA